MTWWDQYDWGRWHELLDIRAKRRFTDYEQAEYWGFLPIVQKADEEQAAIAAHAMKAIVARHAHALASIRELTEAVNAAADAIPSGRSDSPAGRWIGQVREWAASHPRRDQVVDDSRESIYGDRYD